MSWKTYALRDTDVTARKVKGNAVMCGDVLAEPGDYIVRHGGETFVYSSEDFRLLFRARAARKRASK